jgi:tripartite-type tricarboxylate transporter receptor subunit TctC
MVHFKSAPEAFLAVAGGHADATFDFTGNIVRASSPLVKVVGVTGNEATLAPTLRSLGYPETGSLQNIFAFYATNDTPQSTVNEIQELFLKAEKAESVQKLYQIDHATKEPRYAQPGDLSNWYQQAVKEFVRAGKGIVVD